MSEMEAKRHKVSVLLDAQKGYQEIANLVPCSLGLVAKVKKLKKDGKDLGRKPGSGGNGKKRTAEFMDGLSNAIEAAPMTSMRNHAQNLRVDEKTIRNAVKDLGAHSYVRTRHQLLSEASKKARVVKGKKLISWMKHNGSTV